MKTLTEKYRGVLNESFNKNQFVRDARMAQPHLISQFNGFDDTVLILKQKGMISDAAKAEEEVHNLSDEAIRRGVDFELEAMGLMSQDKVSEEDQAKATDKAMKNLEKDSMHYLNILAGESSKVDKHDKPVEIKKGKEVDTFNGMKKADIKENYNKETLLKKLGDADDAMIQTGNGREYVIYNPNSNNDDNAAMWHDTSVFAVDQDGGEHEIDYKDIGLVMVDETTVNEYDQTDGVADYIIDYYKNPKTGKSLIDDEIVSDFFKTHPEWEQQADGTEEGMEAVIDNFKEFLSVNYESGSDYMQEKAATSSADVIDPADYGTIGQNYLAGFGKEHTLNLDQLEQLGRKIVDRLYKGDFNAAMAKHGGIQEKMTDQDMADIAKYGQKDKVVKNFKPGDKFTSDFDYEGMLEFGLKVRLNTPIETLQALFDSFEDVNYHSEGMHLSYAIDSIKEKDKVEALDHLRNFKKAIKATLVSFNEGADPSRKQNEGRRSKTYGKLAEGRRKKTKGGKVVTENDYETGGYVESMGPLFDKGVNFLIKAWEEWKMGPMTEPGMIEFAKKDILSYLETQFMVENLEEKKGKDLDGDGDVDGDDYKHAKDKAIKKAMGKDEIVKENIKSIITKVLEEQVINEAATNELAKFADQYGSFEGMKQAVIQLQDVVTDIESYYDKTRGKIQKVYDTLGDIRNEEGLKVGGFLAPSIESAFNKDLRPVTKSGFTKGLETPKVKVLSKRDIDRHDVGVPNIGEDEKQTVYSAPLNGSLRENKK
tara:strand:- start:1141 stop:3435 length:2295 start_codon:yes stop_codon:yes gene_type:complete